MRKSVKTKILSLVLATLAIVLCFGACNCNPEEFEAKRVEPGQKFFIGEAYNEGMLSKKDLMHISYFFCGEVREWIGDEVWANHWWVDFTVYKNEENWRVVDFKPEIETPVLTDDISEYVEEVCGYGVVFNYFGEYHGYKAVTFAGAGTASIDRVIVGGIGFTFYSSNYWIFIIT